MRVGFSSVTDDWIYQSARQFLECKVLYVVFTVSPQFNRRQEISGNEEVVFFQRTLLEYGEYSTRAHSQHN